MGGGIDLRIRPCKCETNRLGVDDQADFALAFATVHEVPDQHRLRPGGKLLTAEPRFHVPGKAFQQTVATAEELGLRVIEEPRVRWCRAVVLAKL
jgi:hypothetical protein